MGEAFRKVFIVLGVFIAVMCALGGLTLGLILGGL